MKEKQMGRRRKVVLVVIGFVVCGVAGWGWHQSEIKRDRTLDASIAWSAGIATLQYEEANRNHLPVATNWEDAISPYWTPVDSQPVTSARLAPGPHNSPRRLAMNQKLSGIDLARVSDVSRTVLYFETNSTKRNAVGIPPADILDEHSRKAKLIYVCVDGHSGN